MARDESRPGSFVVGVWLAALLLTLIGAPEVSAWLVHDRTLGGQPAMVRLAGALVAISEALHLRRVGEEVDRLVTSARPHAVWMRAEPEPSMPEREPLVDGAVVGADTSAAGRAALLARVDPPRNILIIGASSMQLHFGAELERAIVASYRGVSVERFGKLSTGLVRPDYFDWPKKARELLDESPRDVVIAQFGGNDAQSIAVPGRHPLAFGTPEWEDELGRRASELVDVVRSRGARFIGLGMPMMREPGFSRRMQHVNEVMRKSIERSGGTFISTWDLSGQNGKYSNAVRVDGALHLLRDSDGVHFTRAGAVYMARKVTERLEREVPLLPADEGRALIVRREIDSKALGRRVPYLAYVPLVAASGGGDLPALFLLHGVDGSYADWSEHAQAALKELSVRHGLVIITPEGGEGGWYVDSALVPNSNYASHVTREVVADIEANLPVTKRRGIAGVSAGGHGALTLALRSPGLFSSASSMSGVVDLPAAHTRKALVKRLGPYSENREVWEERSARHLARSRADVARDLPMLITVGRADRWAPENRAFAAELAELGVRHAFEEYEGGHDWRTFKRQLPRHVAWHAEQLAGPPVSSAPPPR